MANDTVGQKLIALRQRSGLSMDKLAKRMGLGGRSSVQRFFVPHLDELGPVDAVRLADAFEGTGDPPITRDEVIGLSIYSGLFEVRGNPAKLPPVGDLRRDVPVYGLAMGTYRPPGANQEVEIAFVDPSDTIDYLARPPAFANRKGLYGLYVVGPSMEPRWEPGDPLYVDPKRPPSIGDDVVVYLVKQAGHEDDELQSVLLKRLVRRSASFVELEQFNPALTFKIESQRIQAVHRVIPRRELLAFH